MNLDDTIVAISSPPGSAARGIVRLSGNDAIRCATSIARVKGDSEVTASIWLDANLRLENHEIPAALLIFRAPRSYTGQDMAEIHTFGSPVLLGMIVESLLARGGRRAEPGEFTARAFLAGKLDLSQVHAVAGMIAARSDQQLRAAEKLLHGALSVRAIAAREELADLLSLVEGAMDFADEPIEFITPPDLRDRLARLHAMLSETIDAGHRAERWGTLPRVLLVGPPNVGKSSLFNRLTGMNRAICSPVAGTTRDAISAPLSLGETECLLVDIAGLEERADELGTKAQHMARENLRDADLILEVKDATDGSLEKATCQFHTFEIPRLVVINKCDLLVDRGSKSLPVHSHADAGGDSIFVSAVTGQNLTWLRDRVAAALTDREVDRRDAAIALMAEHRESLFRAVDAIGRAIEMAGQDAESLAGADLIAAEMRIATDELGMLVGKDQTEDMLGRIFARFCVGK